MKRTPLYPHPNMTSVAAFFRSGLIRLYKVCLRIFGGRGLQRIRPLGSVAYYITNLITRLPRPERISFLGHTFFLDPYDNLGLTFWDEGELHPGELKLVEQFVRNGDVVLDIGANIGFFTLVYARAVGEKGHVFAFEPEPRNASLLRKNIAVNGYRNITVLERAVGEKSRAVKLFLSNYNMGDHRIYDPYERTKSWEKSSAVYDRLQHKYDRRISVDIPLVSIDGFFKGTTRRIDFVKIDVQGAEGGVLKGMLATLRKNKSVKIVTEFWPAGLKMFGVDAEEYLSLFQNLGFSFYEVANEADAPIRPVTKEFLLKRYTVSNNLTGNLFLRRD